MLSRFLPALCVLLSLTAFSVADERPNFILFIADDVSWNDFGCYGNPAARTPAIDKLAAGGLRFTNFYLTASSCSPSRCSIVTGRYPHNNGDAAELHRSLSPHLVKFPSLLKAAGYHTALAGKDHMPQEEPNEELVWDVKRGTKVPGNGGGHGHWVDVVQTRPLDKPFFYWFAATDAHRGWDADKDWKDEYGPKHEPENVVVPPYMVDTLTTRQDLASYYNEVTRFDWYIGEVLEELALQDELDNTVIMVMADNGRPFPRAKTRLHDSGMKSAFVVHWPAGIKQRGQDATALVSAIDIAPTVLTLAGVPLHEQLQGVPFQTMLEDPTVNHGNFVFSEHNWHDYEAHGRSVRDRDGYVYIRNARPSTAWSGPADSIGSPSHRDLKKVFDAGDATVAQADVLIQPRPAEELYFTSEDPLQVQNLVAVAEHEPALKRLREVMDNWQEATGDDVPKDFTPDLFDRDLGYIDTKTGQRIKGRADYRVVPGKANDADKINVRGPR